MTSEKQLLQAFDTLKKAMLDCNVQVLREMLTEEYRAIDPQGRFQDRNTTLEAYSPGGVKLDRYDVDDLEVRIVDTVGIITGTGRIQGTYAGDLFAHHLRFLDVYIHRDGRWRLSLSQVTPCEAA